MSKNINEFRFVARDKLVFFSSWLSGTNHQPNGRRLLLLLCTTTTTLVVEFNVFGGRQICEIVHKKKVKGGIL